MKSAAALALAAPPRMFVNSDMLGPLDVADDEVIEFAAGLFGFPECRAFVLVPAERDGLFWLQSADHSALVFLLVDPFVFFEGYSVDLTSIDRAELQAFDAADVAVLAIVTLPRSRAQQPTANLQGPLALNLRSRRGKQIALADSEFGLRRPIDLSRAAP
jgi:flagellar assembly factor FliW